MEVKLPDTIEECHSLIRDLAAVIGRMQAEIDELKARLNENSQNSNRPPSSDGFNKPQPKPAFSKKKKRRGGQKGHAGKTLKRVAVPDEVVDCEPMSCQCGQTQWSEKAEVAEARQVFELPEPRLQVVEYRRMRRVCRCGRTSCGEFPEEVSAPVQYGGRVQAIVSLLSVEGCLSFGRISRLFGDLYGYRLNEATAQAMLRRTSEGMPTETIKAEIKKAEVAHFDETGIRENGRGRWLHTASTVNWTYQFADDRRGEAAMRSEKSVLANFSGVAVHDCWASYFKFEEVEHALCNAHILRELTGVMETSGVEWAKKMKRLMKLMYRKSDSGKGVIKDFKGYEKRYERLLKQAEKEEPPPEKINDRGKWKRTKGRNLFERMKKHQKAILRFAVEEKVPFTNNQAERDIRPVKVKQKTSGGFRAANGIESYCRINSFISSMRKQSRQVFQELVSIIKGNPFEIFQT